ncbi:MAG: hypothetical protein N3D11_10265 [Candidatus Sumerlaeia bacterium]|nr:hypothetical protein [Candidatus Sumerlaeia bacterium]
MMPEKSPQGLWSAAAMLPLFLKRPSSDKASVLRKERRLGGFEFGARESGSVAAALQNGREYVYNDKSAASGLFFRPTSQNKDTA